MPIAYRIDHDNRLVVARGYGLFSPGDVFDYQTTAWSDPGLAGYDELIDMTHVTEVSLPSAQRIQELASVAARMDVATVRSRFAIVAPTDLAYGLGRMFKVYREADERGSKEVGVFRSSRRGAAVPGPDAGARIPAAAAGHRGAEGVSPQL